MKHFIVYCVCMTLTGSLIQTSSAQPPASLEPNQLSPAALSAADTALLDTIQRSTFRYFWDIAHPDSGMALERSTSKNLVTTGGSGFGVLAIIIAADHGWIKRDQACRRLLKITDFLQNADRFHGAWPHWLNGRTGKTIPFSPQDNGADLVETAFLIQGLLTAREYFNQNLPLEIQLRTVITRLWHQVEWNWFTQGKSVLFWHWSPQYQFQINLPITGWNECLMTYILAASSPTYPISASAYHQGWARRGAIKNSRAFENITIPLGSPQGGPLFFSHYSFLCLDPRGLKDQYADYWLQNRNHTLANYRYCINQANPQFRYRPDCWGLTASDDPWGYQAHCPGKRDNGTITPSAAISAMPYTPRLALQAARGFFRNHHDSLWGTCGFYDAFNLKQNWFSRQYLAIDQGPIIAMIENFRSALLWKLFKKCPDIQIGLKKLGFSYSTPSSP